MLARLHGQSREYIIWSTSCYTSSSFPICLLPRPCTVGFNSLAVDGTPRKTGPHCHQKRPVSQAILWFLRDRSSKLLPKKTGLAGGPARDRSCVFSISSAPLHVLARSPKAKGLSFCGLLHDPKAFHFVASYTTGLIRMMADRPDGRWEGSGGIYVGPDRCTCKCKKQRSGQS